MLELMLDRHVIYVLMGMSAFAGVDAACAGEIRAHLYDQ